MKKLLAMVLSSTILLSALGGNFKNVEAIGITNTIFSNCDTNWTHYEVENTNFREGSGATAITLAPNQIRPLQTGNGPDRFMQITSQNISLSDATGALGLWVWIDSDVSFNFGDIQLSSSENSDTDAYVWNISQWKDILSPGWTWLALKFSAAQKIGSPNPNQLNFMRLFIAHNSATSKRFLIDDMRLINILDDVDLAAPKQVTNFNNCDTNWTHFELETTNFKEGAGATGITLEPNQIRPLQSGTGSNVFTQITSENINLSNATGGLGMWIWIDSGVSFNFGDIQVSSSKDSDVDAYVWNINKWKGRLVPGWTWLTLKFSDAEILGNPNPNSLNFMRLFIAHNSATTKRFLIDDIRLLNMKHIYNISAPSYSDPVIFSNYNVTETTISKIQSNSTVASFLSGLSVRSDTTFVFKSANKILLDNSKVGTDTKVAVYVNGIETQIYSLIIYGDVNGDGAISIDDMVSIKQHLLKSQLLTTKFLVAGDISHKGEISISDLLAVKKQLLNITIINQG